MDFQSVRNGINFRPTLNAATPQRISASRCGTKAAAAADFFSQKPKLVKTGRGARCSMQEKGLGAGL